MLIDLFQKAQGPLTRNKAVTYAIINQLATPGLGSVLGGRFVAGSIQLLFSVLGFVLMMVWFVRFMVFFYNFHDMSSTTTFTGHWAGLTGLVLFVLAWCWSLFTSFSLISGTRTKPPTPPPLKERI